MCVCHVGEQAWRVYLGGEDDAGFRVREDPHQLSHGVLGPRELSAPPRVVHARGRRHVRVLFWGRRQHARRCTGTGFSLKLGTPLSQACKCGVHCLFLNLQGAVRVEEENVLARVGRGVSVVEADARRAVGVAR